MTPERWRQITEVFHGALAREAAARRAFLDNVCSGDSELRREVEAMLAADQDAGRFGETPLFAFLEERRRLEPGAEAPTLNAAPPAAPGGESPPAERPGATGSPSSRAAEGALDQRRADEARLNRSGTTGPRGRQSFVWVVALASVATVVALGCAAWVLVSKGGTSTSFGWSEARRAHRWYVATVDLNGPAAGRLQPGDRVISLDGDPPVVPGGTAFQRRALSVGDTYHLAVERHGEQYTASLVVAAGEGALVRRLSFFMVGLVWCAVGLFIGWARPDQVLPRLACASAVITGLLYLQVGVIERPLGLAPLHAVLGYHFFCRFPTGRARTGTWRAALLVLYAIGGAGAALNLWLAWTLLTQGTTAAIHLMADHSALFPLRQPAFLIAYWGSLVGIVAVVPRNYRLLGDEDQRRRVRWVVYGSIVALAPQFWWAAVTLFESFVGPAPVSGFGAAGDAFTVVLPISVAYAVVKHRVFDIKVAIRRGLQYLLARRALQALVAAPIVMLAYTVVTHRHQTIAELASGSTGYLYWAAAAALMLRFRQPVRRWLDRRFFREEYDREQVLLGLLDDLGKVESMSEVSRLVCRQLSLALHPKVVHLWHRDRERLTLDYSSNPGLKGAEFPAGVRLLSWLEERGDDAAFPLPADAGVSAEEAGRLAALGANLIVPINDSSDRLVGVLVLGEKQSEEPYGASDRRLLRAVAKQAAVVRENLRLRAQVSDEQRIRHDVLARLDGRNLDLLKECPACGACFDGAGERCDRDGELLTLPLPVGRTIEGKYRLDQLIGRGGMGAVYEARDLRLERPVAVKIILARAFGQPASVRRFRREARATARLNHPNIVGMYDVGLLEGEGAYLVMERVYGVTLRAELDRLGALPPLAAAEWFGQLLDGVAAAHAQGIVHRDLKPENVIGQWHGPDSLTVKVLDFGLAKFRSEEPAASGSVTAEGAVMGTLGYMSPEQLLGGEVDQRTDVFAVGVMLVEAVTGQRPFPVDGYAELLRAVLHDGYHLPCSSPEHHALDELLQRCLAKDPHDRFPSGAVLRQALIPALRACPLFARRAAEAV